VERDPSLQETENKKKTPKQNKNPQKTNTHLTPAFNFRSNISHLLRKSTRSTFARSLLLQTAFHRRTESSCGWVSGVRGERGKRCDRGREEGGKEEGKREERGGGGTTSKYR
jgi:hypothetical protein